MGKVNEFLDAILKGMGIDQTHELYKEFDKVFRAGLAFGNYNIFQLYGNQKEDRYYFVHTRSGQAEDVEGKRVSFEVAKMGTKRAGL